ncbi:MAG: hypothetical protein ACTHXA_09165 [Gulosibacter sp.]|uniref:hypothetical protein n=1 Tax=Gulosibacter sp. TaxID=2817531 RepID=UPI003F8F5242
MDSDIEQNASSPVRIAVVGAGLAGVAHSVALRAAVALERGNASDLELVAVASSDEEHGVGDMLALQARSFLAALGASGAAVADLPLPPTFADGLRNMQIIQAITESAERLGAAVEVPGRAQA